MSYLYELVLLRQILERECLLKPETWAKSCGKRHPFSEIAYFAILEKGPGVEDLIPDSGYYTFILPL